MLGCSSVYFFLYTPWSWMKSCHRRERLLNPVVHPQQTEKSQVVPPCLSVWYTVCSGGTAPPKLHETKKQWYRHSPINTVYLPLLHCTCQFLFECSLFRWSYDWCYMQCHGCVAPLTSRNTLTSLGALGPNDTITLWVAWGSRILNAFSIWNGPWGSSNEELNCKTTQIVVQNLSKS